MDVPEIIRTISLIASTFHVHHLTHILTTMAASETLDAEVELIASSLLPEENLSSPSLTWPREIVIANAESQRSLQITIAEEYPKRQAVTVEVKGNDIGRDAAAEWSKRINGFLDSWEDLEE